MNPYQQQMEYYQMMQNQLAQQQAQLQQAQRQNQRTVLDFVQGEASADVYPVQPGQEVILMDVDNPYVYRKARGTDNKLEQHRYRLELDDKADETKPEIDLTGYVKADEIAQIVADAVEKKMSEYTLKPTKKPKQAEEEQ
jgi:hypothetical protein